ncbi:MAG: excinuclease ABC subunit A [Rhodocyclaceae bacterium]|nr:excinuclease ABC subunit A [Rhodocyclaceae bacterium]
MSDRHSADVIRIIGATQNNLKNLDLEIPLGALVVFTGPSGSGKSSLVFDTLYAEGQRRYVETFSPYARQFLDRMDKPHVTRIEGVPPAIAIDQTNPVRTSRSTVGTMTELTDHFKLLFARTGHLHCKCCGQHVQRDTPDSITAAVTARAAEAGDPRLHVTFPIDVPANFTEDEIRGYLEQQGYTRIHGSEGDRLWVIQDRFRAGSAEPARIGEAVEAALRTGQGRMAVRVMDGEGNEGAVWRFSQDFHCADCDIAYGEPLPSLFSFNSPLGACETCRGFGRVIGIDFGLVVPDESKTLKQGAVKPWQTASYSECQDDMEMMAKKAGIPLDVPWRDLTDEQKHWVLEGEDTWKNWSRSWPGVWYGVRRFFDWLETKAYKMHVRVLLSKYRSYTECPSCHGARLKPEALYWRVGGPPRSQGSLPPEGAASALGAARRADGGSADPANDVMPLAGRLLPPGMKPELLPTLPGLCIHDLMQLSIERLGRFMDTIQPEGHSAEDEATRLVCDEIRTRVRYLNEVGLSYLTLDRQSRTLSGGEVQRINLTTALGTSLVNTLFVLDEPSIGLHPRDMDRIVQVMRRLRDAGNSLVVVEHDPAVMLAADHIFDIGPGPGERGGQIVFSGTPDALRFDATTLTADYLSGRKRIDGGTPPQPLDDDTPRLVLHGVREHNLQGIDVALPLGRMVCVTGVSGSGKSTLVQDVLYPALLKHFGQPTEAPGAHEDITGIGFIDDVVMVDQSPIGKSSRSNPVSYVGAWDAVRARFANLPAAKQRGYTPGTFSFNAGQGRCPTCTGSGFEHVEMQFLSDVYLRCPDCDGKRYRPEVLELEIDGRNVADVLEMTVSEALAFFDGDAAIATALQPIIDVGLDYLRLGQPVPTLSGGEAQRLKLAGHLAEFAAKAKKRKPSKKQKPGGTLFLFDEPTTGLHFDDTARLLKAFQKLVDAGHSLLVIEHNLDVIRAADWLVDLGPEGGEGGGLLIAEGTPAEVAKHPTSHTGRALAEYEAELSKPATAFKVAEKSVAYRPRSAGAVSIRHAREHNLKNIDVDIPREGFTVITGVSGSGKSTLAFDILFGEGQRRYLESLNAYARQFVQPAARPEVDAIFGIPPTVAIEQRTSRGGRKSTVATLTELYHFLRLIYVKLGTQYCPTCDVPVSPQSFEAIIARISEAHRGHSVELLAPLINNRKGLYTDLAKWARGKGYEQLRVDGDYLPTRKWPRLDRYVEHTIELPVGMVKVGPGHEGLLREQMKAALEVGKGVLKVLRLGTVGAKPEVFSTHRACSSCGKSFPELDPRLFSFNSKHGWCGSCFGTGLVVGKVKEEEVHDLDLASMDEEPTETCPSCEGARLNPVARAVRFADRPIHALTAGSVDAVADFVKGMALTGREADIARDIVAELGSRLGFLQQVGLGYLALDRAAPTLSGGEAQRIRLAAQLGSSLTGVCYILDEPTIGLHPRDNRVLLDTLAELEAKGNTLVVVEHDEDTIRRADHVIDLGPGAGVRGGRIVAEGNAAALIASPESVTGKHLRAPLQHPLYPPRAVGKDDDSLWVRGASLHNLQQVDARFPLQRLSVVTGVSGSGKSTLARDVLLEGLKMLIHGGEADGCAAIEGVEQIERVLEVDQTPIGKTPRSCPATYVGFWDLIRKAFADTNEARMRGWAAGRFSFNTGDGRCPVCEGQGQQRIEMSFLPDVKVPCEACGGKRFNRETLSVRWRGKTIGEVLNMNVDDAVAFFAAHPRIHHALGLLQDVGLGYLTLGQASPTLSGGEAQRIKLVTELSKSLTPTGKVRGRVSAGQTLYVLDEPTVGLHMADVEKLIHVLHRLVDAGNTVVVIEHDLDVMAEADWLIDLGPEGGDGGGQIVACGPVGKVLKAGTGHTARLLGGFLRGRRARAEAVA